MPPAQSLLRSLSPRNSKKTIFSSSSNNSNNSDGSHEEDLRRTNHKKKGTKGVLSTVRPPLPPVAPVLAASAAAYASESSIRESRRSFSEENNVSSIREGSCIDCPTGTKTCGLHDEVFSEISDVDDSDNEAEGHRSLLSDLKSHLLDDEVSDVVLQGVDGVNVVAVRALLAMRSIFFKTLFFGSFRERGSDCVSLGYNGLVLQAVVEYCFTDEVKRAFDNLPLETKVRSMVDLVSAGNFFQLEGLRKRAYRFTCLMMDEFPVLACAVLDQASGDACEADAVTACPDIQDLSKVALGIMQWRSEAALLSKCADGEMFGVQFMGRSAIERVISDDSIRISERLLFLSLQKWAEYSPVSTSMPLLEHEERVNWARQLSTHINWSSLPPSFLARAVQTSGLVPMEALCEAFKAQAIEAERQGHYPHAKPTIHPPSSSPLRLPPTTGRVVVSGASVRTANGVYVPDDRTPEVDSFNDDISRYRKPGQLAGKGPGEFCLQICFSFGNESRKWYLSFVPANYQSNSKRNDPIIKLYSAPASDDTRPPPMSNWVPISANHEILQRGQRQMSDDESRVFYDSRTGNHIDENGMPVSTFGYPAPICIWFPEEK